jgi:uncharacterized protein YggL (DUF469 family)
MKMRNLSRLTAAANRLSAIDDFNFILKQIGALGFKVRITVPSGSARQVDKATRRMINFMIERGENVTLPDGWSKGK